MFTGNIVTLMEDQEGNTNLVSRTKERMTHGALLFLSTVLYVIPLVHTVVYRSEVQILKLHRQKNWSTCSINVHLIGSLGPQECITHLHDLMLCIKSASMLTLTMTMPSPWCEVVTSPSPIWLARSGHAIKPTTTSSDEKNRKRSMHH